MRYRSTGAVRGSAIARIATVLILTIAAYGCFSDEPDATGPDQVIGATVEMTSDLVFSPATVTIKAGEAVRWMNTSDFVHTATADPSLAQNAADVQLPNGAQPFNSGTVAAGTEYVKTFTVPGEYKYFCMPHETFGMVGTIIVTAD